MTINFDYLKTEPQFSTFADVANGRQQAKLYADLLEKEYGKVV